MAKRGQRYAYRVRYVWTRHDGTSVKGTSVASSLDDANLKADQIEGAAAHHDDRDVVITIVRVTATSELLVGTLDTANPKD